MTLAAAGIAYGIALRVLGWAGETADVAIPREVEPVLVVLILGLVTDYAVFFLSAFREAWPGAGSKYAAMRAATAGTARVVLTAGLIVAAGTAALVVGKLDFFRAFGPGLAITALVAVAVCLTFIPACLALFGGRLAPREDAPVPREDAPRRAPRGLPRRHRRPRGCPSGCGCASPGRSPRCAPRATRRTSGACRGGGCSPRASSARPRWPSWSCSPAAPACCSRRAGSATWTSG